VVRAGTVLAATLAQPVVLPLSSYTLPLPAALQLVGAPLDLLLFKGISKQMLGGRIKLCVSGGCLQR
jgi:hypothetical protein